MFLAIAVTVLSIGISSMTATPTVQFTKERHDLPAQKMETVSETLPTSLAPTFKEQTLKKAPVVVAVAPGNLDALFEKYASEFGADVDLMKRIAKCESGFNAGSNSGFYGGMFQYAADTWSSTRAAMGMDTNPDLRFNAEESIRTTAYKLAHGGKDSWPVCSK